MAFRFIFKLLIFLSPILLMLGLIEHKLASVNSGYRTKRTFLERSIDRDQVIIVGSSHPYYGIKARSLGVPAFNAANVAQDVYYDSRIILKYLPQATNLKLVIVTISYFTFETRLEDYSEGWRAFHYARFWGIPHANGAFRVEDYSLIALYGVPQTRAFLLNGFAASNQTIDEDGSMGDFIGPDRAAAANGRASAELQAKILNPKYVARNVQYLGEMFDALKTKGVNAVIITLPGLPAYYENLRPDVYHLMQDEIQFFCRKYGLSYYNYLKDPRFTVDDFMDGNHLNTQGSEKFSRILRDEIIARAIK
jgi:hypothetical protein